MAKKYWQTAGVSAHQFGTMANKKAHNITYIILRFVSIHADQLRIEQAVVINKKNYLFSLKNCIAMFGRSCAMA